MTAWALLALGLASPARADGAACAAAYRPEYAEEWDAPRSAWDALCAKGYDASDALREAQRASLARCVAKFLPFEQKGKIPVGQTQAYCAQGAAGRASLAEAAGLPPEAPKPPPGPRIPARKPGAAGMGPLSAGLAKVREAWRPDACLSGARYYFRVIGYSDCEETYNAVRENRSARITDRLGFDKYSYFFASPGSERDIYRVTFTDALRTCPDGVYTKGPEHENVPKTAGLTACLEGVSVDVGQAFDIAVKNGWVADETVVGWLAVLPSGFFARACGRDTSALGGPPWMGAFAVRCGDGGWDPAKLRRATGGPVWILTSNDQTAFVDAATGRFRYRGAGDFCLDLPPSYLSATLTDGDPRCSP